MTLLRTAYRWRALLIAVSLAHAMPAAAAVPAAWNDIGFAIDAKGMRLGRALEQFGAAYGVRINSSVNEGTPLNARIKAASGSEFLDRLAASGDFRWFVYNDTVYVVPRADQLSVRLQVGEDAVQDAKAALTGVGLFDARFGWGELPDEGVVMVSGPRAYVDLVRGLLMPGQRAADEAMGGKQIMVFRLKYASATDRSINTRGQKETVPGIKTILSGLLDGDAAPKQGAAGGDIDITSNKHSRRGPIGKADGADAGAGLFGVANDRGGADDKPRAKPAAAAHGDRPRIDADPSLNAIIIYDDVAKRAMYQSLITELDVEPQQIEIEALIVDIDRSKLKELGVEWGVTSGNTTSTVNASGADSQGIDLPLPGSTLLINNAGRFYARLTAMEGSGDARVLAKPTVLTLDNVAAVLDLSQTSYVSLVGERVADLADITVGTMLRVVPRIVKEGATTRVRLEVDIEDGAMDKVNGQNTPQNSVTRSTISTQAIVNAQQTLMIGGYHAESVSRQDQKVPLLGDMPVLGGLFRSTNESHSTRERLFLITPRVTTSAGVAAAELSRANRAARRQAAAEAQRQPAPAAALPPASAALPAAVPAGSGLAAVSAAAPAGMSMAPADAAPGAAFRVATGIDQVWPKKTHAAVCRPTRALHWD
jgi:type III secretion protein C